jgi:phage baseplate assembly protein W
MSYKNIEITPGKYLVDQASPRTQVYSGYSSINVDTLNTTRLYDFDLIKQDLINQFNTRQGERLMNPGFGTIIWSLIFEPFTDDVKQAIIDDITRICNSDPRVVPIQMDLNEQEYGILLELTLQTVRTNQVSSMRITFDKNAGLVSQ